jgi:hypothetical protein
MTMTTSTMKLYPVLGLTLLVFATGFGAGWWVYRPKPLPPSANAPKPEVRWNDSTDVVLARTIDPHAQPQTKVPTGDVVQRIDRVIIQPSTPTTPGATKPATETVDITTVKEPDGGERVIVKPENGTVVSGTDTVVVPAGPVGKTFRWEVTVTRYLRENTYGITGTRAFGPFVAGLTLKQERAQFGSGATTADLAVSVGIRW